MWYSKQHNLKFDLIPAYTKMNQEAPDEIRNLSLRKTEVGYLLEWSATMNQRNPNDAEYFVIYRVPEGEPMDINDPKNIVGTTRDTSFEIIYRNGTRNYMYGVTAVNRYHNESRIKQWRKVRI